MKELSNKRVAIVVTDGFEQVELTAPRRALEEAGARCEIVSPKADWVTGWNHTEWGDSLPVDVTLERADPADYDGLLLPGGVMNPDELRRLEPVQRFVRHFFAESKPVAVICHGPWTLIDCGVAEGRHMTSYHSIQSDLKNAGARWEDREVVVDRNLVTSRRPDDLPAFNREMVRLLARSGVIAKP